ncbi:MAG: hypothetical protein AB7K86_18965 [Rhodospirillales bacterium]
MRRGARAVLLAALLAAPGAAAQDAPASEETPAVLPDGDGRDLVFYGCVPCHSTQIVRRQAMTRERWSDTLDWMESRHGMPPFDPADRKTVLDYLAGHFGPGAAAETPRPFYTPPARSNPFATK